MTSLRARYQSGSWLSISVPRRWLLLDVAPQHRSVQLLWDAISSGEAVEDVLDILISEGVRATPSFVLLWHDERPRAFIKGSAQLLVTAAGQLVEHAARGCALWSEIEVDATAEQFSLAGPEPGGSLELPMASGVTMAARIVVSSTDVAAPAESATLPIGTRAPAEPTAAEDRIAEAAEPETGAVSGDTTLPEGVIAAARDGQFEPGSDDDPSYDYLFGATKRPARSDDPPPSGFSAPAATPQLPVAPARVAEFGATAGWHTVAPSSEANLLAGAGSAAAGSSSVESRLGGLIDAVPWLAAGAAVSPSDAEPHPATALGPELAETEGTVNRATLLAGFAAVPSGPTVLALRCPAGHLTPAHSATCRVCQVAVAEQQPFEVSRPVLGSLHLSTGDSVTLDRGVLIGRKPTAPTGQSERPHLIRVNSPEHDVSRQHAEVVLENWQVYVRDLGSTNGTTVTLPGQAPQRLREGELQLLEPGTVIMLADEVQCVFEVTS